MKMIRYASSVYYVAKANTIQLNLQMVAGLTFPYYSEARITFNPTYKYDLGNDNYDTS
tara:strand:- start:968 stop:1141 length:174 start_codon:yes stop_codon:yes gene_type:complete